jgi:hypothetical protein
VRVGEIVAKNGEKGRGEHRVREEEEEVQRMWKERKEKFGERREEGNEVYVSPFSRYIYGIYGSSRGLCLQACV